MGTRSEANHTIDNEIYRPSIFWSEASARLGQEFKKYGLENFRRLPTALSFFVPTYGTPGSIIPADFQDEIIKSFTKKSATKIQMDTILFYLSGYQAALSDYRTFLAANTQAHFKGLLDFSESSVGNPKERFEFDGKFYSRAAFNYLLGLSFLNSYTDISKVKNILEIGGGFGSLGEIILKTIPHSKYVNIDIPPTLLAAEYYLEKNFGKSFFTPRNYADIGEELRLDTFNRITILSPSKIEKIHGSFDLFVNFISFQEMEPKIVKNYLKNVSRINPKWILLRNLREGKQVKTKNSLGVLTPVVSSDYANMLTEYKLIAQNVIPFGLKTIDNFHSELLLFKSIA